MYPILTSNCNAGLKLQDGLKLVYCKVVFCRLRKFKLG